ncbi:GntR family transcriptional regulator [Pseudoroseomonas wenyumeiae]
MSDPFKPSERLDARPLYQQVETVLIDRIASGAWPPGHSLPAEPELAAELGVSQGTVRKALAELERRNLIERRQGRGTTVLRHTGDTARFHFFRLRDLSGTAVVSHIKVLSCEPGEADDRRRLPCDCRRARRSSGSGACGRWMACRVSSSAAPWWRRGCPASICPRAS